MARIARLAVFLLAIIALTTGCSGDDGNGGEAVTDDAVTTQGRPAVPPEMPEAVEGVVIAPYFDDAGTQTELAVAPGELFSVFIVARHPGYEMTTAQWKLEVPGGVDILGEAKSFEHALSIGSYRDLFVTTYPCQSEGEPYDVLKYTFRVLPEFKGGAFATVEAQNEGSAQPPFIGFMTCAKPRDQVPAWGGTASLTRK